MATASKSPLGDYDIQYQPPLGKGAFGTVYKGRDTFTNEIVAVKQIYYGKGDQRRIQMTAMANKELDAIMKCNEHPYIVQLLRHFEQDRSIWMILEYCDRGDLQDYLEEEYDNLSRLGICETMLQTAGAILFMHNQEPPIIHRDIKLKNVLMKTSGSDKVIAKVCDLGLAKFYDTHSNYSVAFHIQKMSSTQGTGEYMAPEISAELEGGTLYTPSIDVFALGLIFQVLLEPNKPHFCPASVESKEAKQFVNIGYEMVQCHKAKRKLPTVIQDKPGDDKVDKRLKRIIRHMTQFRFYERKSIREVEEELTEIVEELEAERNSRLPSSHVEEIDSRLQATRLSPKLHRIKKGIKEEKNKCKVEDTVLCQHAEVTLNPNTKFKKAKETQLDLYVWSMEMIGHEIWFCSLDGIYVLSTELKELHRLPRGDIGQTAGATDTGSGVVVAALNGLFRLNYQGKQEDRIDMRSYRDMCFSSGTIFATLHEDPYSIEVYDAQTRQHQRSILVQCPGGSRGNHIHTLTIHNQHIFIACYLADNVCRYILDGTLISTHGGFGRNIGEFQGPYICHINTPEHVLVADRGNHRLHMLCDGEWHELQLEPPPQCLRDAILTQHALYVLQDIYPRTIVKYVYK